LKSTAARVGLVAIAASIAGLPAQRWFGHLSDRLGPYRVMMVSGLLIPFLPILWIFTGQPWHAIPVNAFGGLVWAGFNLAAFNFFLSLAPSDQIPRYSALLQIAVAIAVAIGAALGGVIATRWGYHAVFLVSGIGRFLGILVFLRFVRPIKTSVPAPMPAV
jgi:predicted MFS family arabinose efflux permease